MDCGHLAVHHAVDEQQPHASAARALEELDQRLHVLEHAVPASAPPQSRRFMMALRARTQTTDVGCQHRLNTARHHGRGSALPCVGQLPEVISDVGKPRRSNCARSARLLQRHHGCTTGRYLRLEHVA
eukprot:1086466-Rhodomonas_salina.2